MSRHHPNPFRKGTIMRRFLPVALILVAIVGCEARLENVGTVNVIPGEIKSKVIEAINKEQKIKVVGTATTGQFNVFVYLQKDQTECENAINSGRKTTKMIVQKNQSTQAELTALIPANQVAIVSLTSADGKPGVVSLKITN